MMYYNIFTKFYNKDMADISYYYRGNTLKTIA